MYITRPPVAFNCPPPKLGSLKPGQVFRFLHTIDVHFHVWMVARGICSLVKDDPFSVLAVKLETGEISYFTLDQEVEIFTNHELILRRT